MKTTLPPTFLLLFLALSTAHAQEKQHARMPWHLVDIWWDLGKDVPFESCSIDVNISALERKAKVGYRRTLNDTGLSCLASCRTVQAEKYALVVVDLIVQPVVNFSAETVLLFHAILLSRQ